MMFCSAFPYIYLIYLSQQILSRWVLCLSLGLYRELHCKIPVQKKCLSGKSSQQTGFFAIHAEHGIMLLCVTFHMSFMSVFSFSRFHCTILTTVHKGETTANKWIFLTVLWDESILISRLVDTSSKWLKAETLQNNSSSLRSRWTNLQSF